MKNIPGTEAESNGHFFYSPPFAPDELPPPDFFPEEDFFPEYPEDPAELWQPAEPSLDISRINLTPLPTEELDRPSELQRKRRIQFERRARSARFLQPLAKKLSNGFIRPVRPARCGWAIGGGVTISKNKETGRARYSDTERCESIWACPCCSALIRQERAKEIEKAVTEHQKSAGQVLFFTSTVQHFRNDRLSDLFDLALSSFHRLLTSRLWKRLKKERGLAYIRSVEITYGRNGWHPHIHSLIFLDQPLSEEELEELKESLFSEWIRSVVKEGGRSPKAEALDLQVVDQNRKILSKYLAKVQEKRRWGVGSELARGDLKQGGSMAPFDLLDEETELNGRLWREYYQATWNRRAITWSRGLKARYDIEEKEDSDLLEEENQKEETVWITDRESYTNLGVEDRARALELAEAENWQALNELLPQKRRVENSQQVILSERVSGSAPPSIWLPPHSG